jgi:succinate dehydrogenase / fumarate reductase membrane anchor subunit
MKLVFTGLRAWIWQRISAVYLLAFVIYALIRITSLGPMSYEQWRAWLMSPLMNGATVLFFLLLLLHVWIGVRNVLLDYVHPLAWRTTALALVNMLLIAQAVWVVRILW